MNAASSLIKAIADKSTAPELHKQCEEGWNGLREQDPKQALEQILALTVECLEKSTSSTDRFEQTACQAALTVFKNTLPKVWANLDVGAQRRVRETVFTSFTEPKVPRKVRRRVGFVLENLITDDGCNTDAAAEEFRSGVMPLLFGKMGENPREHALNMFYLFADGMSGLNTAVYRLLNQDANRQKLQEAFTSEQLAGAMKGEAEVYKEFVGVKSLVYLRFISLMDGDSVGALAAFVPFVLEALQQTTVDLQKDLLAAMQDAAGKDIFVPRLTETLQTVLAVCRDPATGVLDAELKAPGINAIVAIAEAVELGELMRNEALVKDIVLILLSLLADGVENVGTEEHWLKLAANKEDDTEDDVKLGVENLDLLLDKTTPTPDLENDEEDEDDEEQGSSEEPMLLPFLIENIKKQHSEIVDLERGFAAAADQQGSEQRLRELNSRRVAMMMLARTVQTYVKAPENTAFLLELALQNSEEARPTSAPRVRFECWNLISQLASEHGPFVTQEEVVPAVLGRLSQALANEPTLRVKARILDALIYFLANENELETEDVHPFLDALLKPMAPILAQACSADVTKAAGDENAKQSALVVSTGVLNCITSLMQIAGKDFGVYYADLMPEIMKLLSLYINNTEARELLGAVIECASALGTCVEAAVFRTDALVLIQAVVAAMTSSKLANDPVRDYAFQAAQNLTTVLKGEMKQFLPAILPEVMAKLDKNASDLQSDVSTMQFDQDQDGNELLVDLAVVVDQATGEKKVMCIRTGHVEDMQNALSLLLKFIDELGADYAEYAEQTVEKIAPLLKFDFAEDVRMGAMDVWSGIAKLCRDAGNRQALDKLVFDFADEILALWRKADEHSFVMGTTIHAQANGLGHLLMQAGPGIFVGAKQGYTQTLAAAAMKQLQESVERDAGEEDSDDTERDCQIALVSIFGALMKHHGEAFCASCLPDYVKVLQQYLHSPDAERHTVALFLSADFLEYLPRRAVEHWGLLLEPLTKDISAKKLPNIVQPAAFALSLLVREPEFGAHSGGNAARVVGDLCAKYINKVRTGKSKAFDYQKEAACDNCLTCLGNILYHHSQALAGGSPALGDYFAGWLKALPATADDEEAVNVHGLVLKFVREENALVMQGGNFVEVVRILTSVYRTQKANDEINTQIQRTVARVPQQMLDTVVANFSDKQKKKIVRIWNDCKLAEAGAGSAGA